MAAGRSYNGWQANDVPSVIGVDRNFSAAGATFPGGVKAGPVSVVFRYLVERLHNEVEPTTGYGCWGYGYRANVNNPSTLSCHASATAIDYNAPKHPNGTSTGPNGGGGWSGDQYRKIKAILADLDGVVRWLNGNDPMHFEISGSETAVALVAAKLGGKGVGTGPEKPSAPSPAPLPDPEPIEDEDDMPYSPEQLVQFATSGAARAIQENDGGCVDKIVDALLARKVQSFDGTGYSVEQFLQSINEHTAAYRLNLDTPVAIEELGGGTVPLSRVLEMLVSRTGKAEQAANQVLAPKA